MPSMAKSAPSRLLDVANAAEVVAADADAHVRGDAEAERLRVDLGAVAAQHVAFLERADPAKALRRREMNARRQVDVRDPAVALQRFENLAINGVKLRDHS